MSARIGILVQARMSSRRFPGKVLHPFRGRPLLGFLLDRLALCREPECLAVATSAEPSDDPVARFCAQRGTPCFRGPLEDVAGRLAAAARELGLDAFVRVCADSPLLDPGLVDRAVALFRSRPCHLVSNIQKRSFPKGQSVEVVDTAAFCAALPEMADPGDREHVTPWLYRHPDRVSIVPLRADQPRPEAVLCVDAPADLDRLEAALAAAGSCPLDWRDCLALLDACPPRPEDAP